MCLPLPSSGDDARPLTETERAQFEALFAKCLDRLRTLARRSIATDLRRKLEEADIVQVSSDTYFAS